MKISVIHPSYGRPVSAINRILDTLYKASLPCELEYFLVLEISDPCVQQYRAQLAGHGLNHLENLTVLFASRRECVNATNLGASKATGDILISVADDLEACQGWNDAIRKAAAIKPDSAIWIDDGIEHASPLITIPCCDRAYYQRRGYLAHPDYKSLWSDNDWTAVAFLEGRVCDARSYCRFRHMHRSVTGRDDATYQHTSSAARNNEGREIFLRRQAAGFADVRID